VIRIRIRTAAGIEGSEIESRDLAAQIAVNPRLIGEGRQSTRKQSANIVRIQEVGEEIGIRRVIKDPGAVIREIETKDVTVAPAQAGHTLQTVQKGKLDPHPEKSHEVPLAVHSRINQKSTQRKAKFYRQKTIFLLSHVSKTAYSRK